MATHGAAVRTSEGTRPLRLAAGDVGVRSFPKLAPYGDVAESAPAATVSL
jgi:hypothetical protein